MDYSLGTQSTSVDWNLIDIWCCGEFFSCADIPAHAQLCHEGKTCKSTGHMRRACGGGSYLPGVVQSESAQFPQKLGTGNEKIDDEATDETYNSSITHSEITLSVDNLDMKDTFEETNYVKGDTRMETRANLKLDLDQHEGVAYNSDHCKQIYNAPKELAHGHGGEKRFSCDQCDYKAKRKNHMKMHKESVHDVGEKRFSCDQCDYKVKRKSNLKRHKESIHEGIAHACDQCDFTATWKSNVKVHKESVHDGITYSCKQCDYITKQKTNLKRHKESFHDGVTYSCDKCDYKAKWKGHLKRHKKSVHENITQS